MKLASYVLFGWGLIFQVVITYALISDVVEPDSPGFTAALVYATSFHIAALTLSHISRNNT